MDISVSFYSALPDPAAYHDLLREYYAEMVAKFQAVGGPYVSADEMAAESLDHIDEVLPPNGRTLLAHDPEGNLVGCGTIRMVRPDAAELKRMYVRASARGTGLGRKLFEMRFEEAKRMGCRVLLADTIKGNRAMLAMYEKMGYSYIPRYPENANPAAFAPYLVYLEYRFPNEDD